MAKVEIYTRQFCGFCSAAKNLLREKRVKFTEFDATFDPKLRQQMIKRSEGGKTFPQIFIGDFHVGGCDELMMMERSNKLDALLKK